MEIKHRIEIITLIPGEVERAAEIGVAEGNFSRDLLASGVKQLVMVDAWQHIPNVTGDGNFDQHWHDRNYDKAREAVAPFGDRAHIIKSFSVEAARLFQNDFFDFVYLDAAHYYDGVYADLVAWYPKIRSGGIFAGHDYLNPDYQVKEAVRDFIADKNMDVYIIPENNTNDASFWFRKP